MRTENAKKIPVLLLLISFFLLNIMSAANKGMTYDERGHYK